jgi:hypothetical protein
MKELKPIEFKNKRIITTKLLAEQFETNEQNISRNFTRNQDRFIEGKHYFKLEGNELKNFKGYVLNDDTLKYASILYLWTEKGVARHAKMLETDEAWKVYEDLEDTYFKVKDNQLQLSGDMSKQIAEIVHAQLEKQFSQQIEKVDEKYSENYRPTALNKYNISKYIKTRLGILKANEEYEMVKQRLFIVLGIKQWQDIPISKFQNSIYIIDECIDVIKKDRPYQQMSLI